MIKKQLFSIKLTTQRHSFFVYFPINKEKLNEEKNGKTQEKREVFPEYLFIFHIYLYFNILGEGNLIS